MIIKSSHRIPQPFRPATNPLVVRAFSPRSMAGVGQSREGLGFMPAIGAAAGGLLPGGAGLISGAGASIGAGAAAGSVVPIIGTAIGAGVMGITALIGHFRKRGKQKVAATQVVEAVAPYMDRNLKAYMQSGHTEQEQAQAVKNFYDLWNIVVEKCANPALGDAGKRCTGDRVRGGKLDWFRIYLDPIEKDPNVVRVQSVAAGRVSGQGTGTGSSLFGLDPKLVALAVVGLVALTAGG